MQWQRPVNNTYFSVVGAQSGGYEWIAYHQTNFIPCKQSRACVEIPVGDDFICSDFMQTTMYSGPQDLGNMGPICREDEPVQEGEPVVVDEP